MNKIVRLTESDLTRIVRRVINEESIFNRSGSSSKSLPPNCTKAIMDKTTNKLTRASSGDYSYDREGFLILKNQGKEFCSIKMS